MTLLEIFQNESLIGGINETSASLTNRTKASSLENTASDAFLNLPKHLKPCVSNLKEKYLLLKEYCEAWENFDRDNVRRLGKVVAKWYNLYQKILEYPLYPFNDTKTIKNPSWNDFSSECPAASLFTVIQSLMGKNDFLHKCQGWTYYYGDRNDPDGVGYYTAETRRNDEFEFEGDWLEFNLGKLAEYSELMKDRNFDVE